MYSRLAASDADVAGGGWQGEEGGWACAGVVAGRRGDLPAEPPTRAASPSGPDDDRPPSKAGKAGTASAVGGDGGDCSGADLPVLEVFLLSTLRAGGGLDRLATHLAKAFQDSSAASVWFTRSRLPPLPHLPPDYAAWLPRRGQRDLRWELWSTGNDSRITRGPRLVAANGVLGGGAGPPPCRRRAFRLVLHYAERCACFIAASGMPRALSCDYSLPAVPAAVGWRAVRRDEMPIARPRSEACVSLNSAPANNCCSASASVQHVSRQRLGRSPRSAVASHLHPPTSPQSSPCSPLA